MALQVYKVLGQVKIPTINAYQDLYTVPANATAQVYVVVNNFASSTKTFRVAISKDGAVVADGDVTYQDISLARDTTVTTATLTLAAGDIIRVQANDTDFTFQAHGAEIYTPAQGVYFDVWEYGSKNTVRLYNIEENLNYLNYTDEDGSLKIGFKGYGDTNELSFDFPSPSDRDVFVAAFEQARLYGTTGTDDPGASMIYVGSNIDVSGEEITTTSTSTTTTTTIGGPTTTTTSTTTTTTIGPPILIVNFTIGDKATAKFEALTYTDTEDPLTTLGTIVSRTSNINSVTYPLVVNVPFAVNVITDFSVNYRIDRTLNGDVETVLSTFRSVGPVYGAYNPSAQTDEEKLYTEIGEPILPQDGEVYTVDISVTGY